MAILSRLIEIGSIKSQYRRPIEANQFRWSQKGLNNWTYLIPQLFRRFISLFCRSLEYFIVRTILLVMQWRLIFVNFLMYKFWSCIVEWELRGSIGFRNVTRGKSIRSRFFSGLRMRCVSPTRFCRLLVTSVCIIRALPKFASVAASGPDSPLITQSTARARQRHGMNKDSLWLINKPSEMQKQVEPRIENVMDSRSDGLTDGSAKGRARTTALNARFKSKRGRSIWQLTCRGELNISL